MSMKPPIGLKLTTSHSLMYAAAYVTTEKIGMLKKRKERRTEAPNHHSGRGVLN